MSFTTPYFNRINLSGVNLTSSGSSLVVNGMVVNTGTVSAGGATGNPVYSINTATGNEILIYSNNNLIVILDPTSNPDIINPHEIQLSGRVPNINEIPQLSSELSSKMTSGQFSAGGYSFPTTLATRLQVLNGTTGQLSGIVLGDGEIAVVKSGASRGLRIGDGSTLGGKKLSIDQVDLTLPIQNGGTSATTISGARAILDIGRVSSNFIFLPIDDTPQIFSGDSSQLGTIVLNFTKTGIWRVSLNGNIAFNNIKTLGGSVQVTIDSPNYIIAGVPSTYYPIYPCSGFSTQITYVNDVVYEANVTGLPVSLVQYLGATLTEGEIYSTEYSLSAEYLGTA